MDAAIVGPTLGVGVVLSAVLVIGGVLAFTVRRVRHARRISAHLKARADVARREYEGARRRAERGGFRGD